MKLEHFMVLIQATQLSTVPGATWINLLAAVLTPTIALAALTLGVANYRLAARRRKDELFDRRYQFYQRVRSIWLSTNAVGQSGETTDLETEDLVPIAEEAEFLFGEDIARHIMSLAGAVHTGSPFFPNEDFVAPFRRYLSLEGRR